MENKLKKICSLINEHNENIGLKANEEGFVNEADTIKCLKIIGASKEDSARKLRYEDIVDCLPSIKLNGKSIKPIQLSKEIARVFRNDHSNGNNSLIEKILNSYDPSDHGSKQHSKLNKISKEKPFIVYDNNKLLKKESIMLLREITSGMDHRKSFIKDGRILNVLHVGESPNQLVDENPCFENTPLGFDETCTITGFDWSKFNHHERCLARLIVKRSKRSVEISDVREIMNFFLHKNYMEAARLMYPDAYDDYLEMKESNNFPNLKVNLNKLNKKENNNRIKI